MQADRHVRITAQGIVRNHQGMAEFVVPSHEGADAGNRLHRVFSESHDLASHVIDDGH